MGDIIQTVFVDSEEPISDGESSIDLSGSSGDDFGHEYPVVSWNMLVPDTAWKGKGHDIISQEKAK